MSKEKENYKERIEFMDFLKPVEIYRPKNKDDRDNYKK